MNDYVHIDENINIRRGQEAKAMLEKESDLAYFEDGRGVSHVPRSRWDQAQRAEMKQWMEIGLRASDDRNREHWQGFDHYKAIAGRSFAHALEIGCGPFTNLRHIGTLCHIETCSLADPLIERYLTHPRATYTASHLYTQRPAGRIGRLVHKVLFRLLPGLRRCGLHRIPIRETIPLPTEEMTVTPTYDLVVFINVLEHCFDAERCFDTLRHALRPGGTLIFCDKLYDSSSVQTRLQHQFDATHPLRVDKSVIQTQLESFTTPQYSRVQTFESRVENQVRSYEALYYIGTRTD